MPHNPQHIHLPCPVEQNEQSSCSEISTPVTLSFEVYFTASNQKEELISTKIVRMKKSRRKPFRDISNEEFVPKKRVRFADIHLITPIVPLKSILHNANAFCPVDKSLFISYDSLAEEGV
ncbi:predicted protein [Chaetoceros tenuissimus]|uniref:Uncharacterized protein n=1 Tax=Chaetoceros tenuissimus TaxID=426638 RepID=A0AAD3D3M6_9STRA|nr:predicted protein [Chaetoceros tenuissimus]